jgi:hypothetical protein
MGFPFQRGPLCKPFSFKGAPAKCHQLEYWLNILSPDINYPISPKLQTAGFS